MSSSSSSSSSPPTGSSGKAAGTNSNTQQQGHQHPQQHHRRVSATTSSSNPSTTLTTTTTAALPMSSVTTKAPRRTALTKQSRLQQQQKLHQQQQQQQQQQLTASSIATTTATSSTPSAAISNTTSSSGGGNSAGGSANAKDNSSVTSNAKDSTNNSSGATSSKNTLSTGANVTITNICNAGTTNIANSGSSKDGKEHHSRSYPRGVTVDFRKLASLTLLNYIDHHGVPVRPEAPPSELAVAVARHFEAMDVDEDECIGGFLERLEVGGCSSCIAAPGNPHGSGGLCSSGGSSRPEPTEYGRNTAYFDGYQMPLTVRKRQRSKIAARPGEQVAAKVTRTDENGSWILASVQRFFSDTETYDVQDEDDTSKLIRLPWNHVMRLSTGGEGVFTKGTDCMAIFPETTSFYRARISKQPVWKLTHTGSASLGSSSSTHKSGNGLTSGASSNTHHTHHSTGNSTNNHSAATSAHSTSANNNSVVSGAQYSYGGTPLVKEMIVKFEDDEDSTTGKTPHRRVPARYVIPLPANYFYDEMDDVDLSLALPPPGTNPIATTATNSKNTGHLNSNDTSDTDVQVNKTNATLSSKDSEPGVLKLESISGTSSNVIAVAK